MTGRPAAVGAIARRARNRLVTLAKGLRSVDPTSYVHRSSRVARDLRTEEFAFVGPNCVIGPGTSIGRYSMLAAQVAVVGDDHGWNQVGVPIQFTGRPPQRHTNIGRDVWVGHGATIMRGLTIGDGAIVAAGAVVTKDVPAFEIWAGVPAARISKRFDSEHNREVHKQVLREGRVTPSFAGRQSVRPER